MCVSRYGHVIRHKSAVFAGYLINMHHKKKRDRIYGALHI